MEKFTFIVSEEESGIPLKKVIKNKYHFSSRLMTKIKYQDLLLLNGKKVPGYYTAEPGDTVTVSIPDEKSHFEPEDIPIKIIYEDDDFLVINKQPGVTCHPTKGHPNHTMANAIMKYMEDTDQSFKIRFINRLDMDTSGVLLIGKNSFVQAELIKQMDHDSTEKKYLAVVMGDLISHIKEGFSLPFGIDILSEDSFLIDLPIGHPEEGVLREVVTDGSDRGYPSRTLVKVKEAFKDSTLIEVTLFTGRTHQIRVHLSYLGHPLLGDSLYGGPMDLINRQALHAESFTCTHPVSGKKLTFKAKIPRDLEDLIHRVK